MSSSKRKYSFLACSFNLHFWFNIDVDIRIKKSASRSHYLAGFVNKRDFHQELDILNRRHGLALHIRAKILKTVA